MPGPATPQRPRTSTFVGDSPALRSLPAGVLVNDVADRSRAALVSFLRLAAGVVERPLLALWLFGPYLHALSVGRASIDDTEPSFALDDVAREGREGEESAAETVAKAVTSIERVLVAFHREPDFSIEVRLVEQGVIEPVIDEDGGIGFAPLGGPRMPLGVRVLALAAAEMLTRPERLHGDLVVSANATGIGFADRTIASGVGLRSRQTLPWAPPEGTERNPGWPARAPSLAELVAAADAGDPTETE